MHPYAAKVLLDMGVSDTHFVARQLTLRMASEANLIVTMTKEHRDGVLHLAPRRLNATFTLSEVGQLAFDCDRALATFADLRAKRPELDPSAIYDIPDPIGRDEDFFSTIAYQIADLIPAVVCVARNELADKRGY